MELSITGRHVAVTDAMREHARARAEKLEHLSSHLMRVQVTLAVEGDRQLAEVSVTVRSKGELVAKAQSHDMYLSIDQALTKIEKQLHKVEERFRRPRDDARQKRTEARGIETSEPVAEAEGPEEVE